MAHLSEGTLRRIVDDADAHKGADGRHLDGCPACQARLKSVADDARSITGLMAAPELKLDVASAFNRVKAAPAARPRFGFHMPLVRPGSRPMVLAFAAVVAAVALLATVIAQDNNVFAPTTVTAVPVTLADMQSLGQLSAYGDVSWPQKPALQFVTSADEAQSISGLKPPTVTVPTGVSKTVTYAATPKATAVFTFSSAKAAAAAAQAGKTLPALPAGMEGAQLTVTVGPAVAEIFGNMQAPAAGTDTSQLNPPQLVVAESSAPVATSTQVSVKQLEDYLLAQPGISAQLKAAIMAIGDPSTTLPIPIPVEYATSSNVTVQTSSGTVNGIGLGDNTGVGAGVIFVNHGVVYGVLGTVKLQDAQEIANHLS